MALHIETLSLRTLLCLTECVSYATSAGRLSVMKGEKLIAVLLTMRLLKFFKGPNTICQLIFGV